MNNNLEKSKKYFFEKSVFVLYFLTTALLWGLGFEIIREIFQEINQIVETTPSNFLNGLFSDVNINRLGLVFQMVGLISVVPELSKRTDIERWERWFHVAGEKSEKSRFSLKDLLWISPKFWFETRGEIGLVNLISRLLAMVYSLIIIVPIFFNRITSEGYFLGLAPIIIFLALDVFWFLITCLDISLAMRNQKLNSDLMIVYSFLNFGLLISIFFYIPVALLVLIVMGLLGKIARNPIETILVKATFPFVLIGTVLEFISTL